MKKPNRIWIMGASGSGKTTFANKLSKELKIKHYQLDHLYWTKRWGVKRDKTSRDNRLVKIARKRMWIIEGPYGVWIESGIKNAELVILLDFSLQTIVKRLFSRHLKGMKENHPQSWKDLFKCIIFSTGYKLRNTRFLRQIKMIERHRLDLRVIKNENQLEEILRELTK